MIDQLPLYVSVVFILTTLLTVWLFLRSFGRVDKNSLPARLLIFLIPFWLLLQGFLGSSDFYQVTDVFPPRVFAFGVLPVLLLVIFYFIFFRQTFIEKLSLNALTLLHVVRIPVEIVLLWLFQYGKIPQIMTFEGSNFDILSGITAPIIFWLAFRNGKVNRQLMALWNIIAVLLLVNIVTIAFLAFPSPMQQLALDQPNVAVKYFPFIWLPSLIVPIALFSHLASLWKLFRNRIE